MASTRNTHRPRFWRALGLLGALFVVVTVAWWLIGRITLDDRRLTVRQWSGEPAPAAATDSLPGIRILAWNMAHGRGDTGPGLLRNWRGGGREARVARLARMADVVRRVDPDLLVLNEVDFDSHWSGGLNQAEVLARALGYPVWVEQRNYDMRFPFGTLSFGNAVLSRFPVAHAEWVPIPPHSELEAWVAGAKGASVVHLETPGGPLALVPVHLEVRSEATRRAAVPVLDSLRAAEATPIVLAGDFNSSPRGWPGAVEQTALADLLAGGWRSPRAVGSPGLSQWTYPSYELGRAIDWVLVEPPLRILEADVLEGTAPLSDHLPVLSVITVDTVDAGTPVPDGGPEG